MIATWQKVWRNGAAPLLSTTALEALESALLNDDHRLIQGATTTPPPLACVRDFPVKAACLLGFCAVVECGGFQVATVEDVETTFGKWCYDIDQSIGEPAGCRWLLNYFDDTPRDVMRQSMLLEIQRTLQVRFGERQP